VFAGVPQAGEHVEALCKAVRKMPRQEVVRAVPAIAKIGEEAVDASGKLVTGEEVNGPVALRQALLTRKHLFVRHITEKMLAYALGRGLEYYDIPAVKQVTETLAQEDYRASRLVMEVVRSVPFRLRRGAKFEEGAVAAKE
jgi:hypothetical protein